jgi:hypothetical protein
MRLFLPLILSLFSNLLGAKTLIITDSHGEGAFGAELVNQLESIKKNVSIYAVGGSTPADWNLGQNQIWGYWEYHTDSGGFRSSKPKTPLLKNLLEKHQPDQVIIELGTNLIWRELNSQITADVIKLVQSIEKAKTQCFWIGPPDLRPNSVERESREAEIHQLLETEIPRYSCRLIRSWEMTEYPKDGGDGIHYDQIPDLGINLAKAWAQKVMLEIENNSL